MPKTKKVLKTKTKKIKEQVMEKISAGNVKMHPRLYFVLGTLFLIGGIVVSILFATFFTHHFIFRFGFNRPFSYFGMGGPGIRPFFLSFPWLSLGIAVGSIILGLELIKKHDISYKKNFSVFVLAVIMVVILLVLFLLRIRFSERVRKVRGVERFYRQEFRKDIPTPPSFGRPPFGPMMK